MSIKSQKSTQKSPIENQNSTPHRSVSIPMASTNGLENITSQFKTSKYRWVTLVSYFIILFLGGAVFSLFIPFSTFLEKLYGIQHTLVVLTAFSFNALYPVANFSYCNKFMKKFGTKISVFLL